MMRENPASRFRIRPGAHLRCSFAQFICLWRFASCGGQEPPDRETRSRGDAESSGVRRASPLSHHARLHNRPELGFSQHSRAFGFFMREAFAGASNESPKKRVVIPSYGPVGFQRNRHLRIGAEHATPSTKSKFAGNAAGRRRRMNFCAMRTRPTSPSSPSPTGPSSRS